MLREQDLLCRVQGCSKDGQGAVGTAAGMGGGAGEMHFPSEHTTMKREWELFKISGEKKKAKNKKTSL